MFCKSYFAEQTIFWGTGPNIPSTISYTLQWNVFTEMVTIAIFFHNPISAYPLILLICWFPIPWKLKRKQLFVSYFVGAK